MALSIPVSQHDEVISRYKNGESALALAKAYGCSYAVIYRILDINGIERRSNKENSRKYHYDEHYFDKIDDEHKAYWLGFIYADGYVKEKSGNNSAMVGIALSDIDRAQLEKFKADLKADYNIYTYEPSKGENSYNSNPYCRIQLMGDTIVNALKEHGVLPNKSLILKPTDIPEDLVPHFIRGYIDGDGSITKTHTNPKKVPAFSLKIIGTEEMLNYIADFIELNTSIKVNNFYKRKDDSKVFSLEVGGNKQVESILTSIYGNATVYLDRKYERYIELCNRKRRA